MTHWLLESVRNMQEPPEAFLSARELEKFAAFRFEKRRTEWLLGRWTAKRLLQALALLQTDEILTRSAFEILNEDGGAPRVHAPRDRHNPAIAGLEGWNLSISHSNERALCVCVCGTVAAGAFETGPAGLVGADLEWIEPRDASFVQDYFTASERARVHASSAAQRDTVVTAIWSTKEAALKALHKGLSVDTRTLEISIAAFERLPAQWTPIEIRTPADYTVALHGWWRVQEGFVLSIVTSDDDVPDASPLCPETVLVSSGAFHEGHGILHQRIAHSTRHHARHARGD